MANFTHFDESGAAHMVDVGHKPATERLAIAAGRIRMQEQTLRQILQGGHRKGDVLGVARIAGIMACKRTAELIPLCHPIPITRVEILLEEDALLPGIRCEVQVATRAPTGVEMEALVAVQITLLTVYDMCKSVDRGMCIEEVGLLQKSGGKSGVWTRESS
jgi:cyclic pyranopterin phosphate synthase